MDYIQEAQKCVKIDIMTQVTWTGEKKRIPGDTFWFVCANRVTQWSWNTQRYTIGTYLVSFRLTESDHRCHGVPAQTGLSPSSTLSTWLMTWSIIVATISFETWAQVSPLAALLQHTGEPLHLRPPRPWPLLLAVRGPLAPGIHAWKEQYRDGVFYRWLRTNSRQVAPKEKGIRDS